MSALTLIQASVPGGCGELEFQHKHVLLVDDNKLLASRIRSTLKFLVQSHEFVVTTVATGVEAIRAIMAFDFDIIICDMMMPHMAGDMFYLAMQRIKPQLVPRLLFVSDPESHEANAYLKSIDAQVVFKPVGAKDLECGIKNVLGRKKRAPGDIDLANWQNVPCVTDRVATEVDVRAGRAVFCIRPVDNISVNYADIGLPRCAVFTDENAHQFPVVIIQSEMAGDVHYVGFRFLAQGNGIGFRSEVSLLDGPNELFARPTGSPPTTEKTDGDASDSMLTLPAELKLEKPCSRLLHPGDIEKSRALTKKMRHWASVDGFEKTKIWSEA